MSMNRCAMVGILFAVLSMSATTAQGQIACIGDCDGDSSVTIDEIIRMVDVVLGGEVSQCVAGDRNADGTITVDEVLTAVTNALLGCQDGPLPGPDLTRVYPAPLLPVGDQPRSMAVADLDGDGDLDAVSADYGAAGLSLLLQQEDGRFASARRIPTDDGPHAVIATALDEDPRPDLVAVNELSDSVTVALSVDSYTTPRQVAVGAAPVALVAGFFNRDIFNDVAVANRDSGDVSVLLGDGLGNLSGEQRFDAGGNPVALASADVDGDQRLDLVAGTTLESVSILLAMPDGGFAAPVSVALPFAPTIVVLTGVDDDELVDLLVLGTLPPPAHNSSVAVLLGNGDGSFGAPQIIDTGAVSSSMSIADMDSDDAVDIVAGNEGAVTILFGRGDGTFGEPALAVINGIAAAVVAADLDADGVPDVGYADGERNDISILWGLGERALAAEAVVPVDGMSPMQILTADVDANAAPDLLTVNLVSEDVSVLLNDGAGGLSSPILVATEPGLLVAAVGQIDDDGVPDLVTAHEHSECFDCILVYEGLGDGRFEQRQLLAARARIMALEIADIEDDQTADVVGLNSASVSLFRGLEDWAFESERQFAAGSEPRALAVGDLDGDMILDVAVVDGGSRSAGVLLSTGAGGFAPPIFLPLTFDPARIRIADVDSDGVADILVQGGDRFSLLQGEGGGTFGPERRLHGIAGGEFDLADVNADGLLDLVALSQGISIYPGIADGPFAALQRFAANPLAADIVAVDLNGDEIAELVTANAAFDGTVSVIGGR
jgi:hypothetical protein